MRPTGICNALANPQVTVRIDDERRAGTAFALTDDDVRRQIGDLMGAKYPWDGDPSIGLTFEKWCYEVPVLAVSGWQASAVVAQ